MDGTAQRQHGAVADGHGPGIVKHRRLIEREIASRQHSGVHTLNRNRLAVTQRDHRVAGAVFAQMRDNIGEALESGIADEIDLVLSDIEAVDDVVADRLREYELIRAARTGEVVVS